jgi:hypothetical protein
MGMMIINVITQFSKPTGTNLILLLPSTVPSIYPLVVLNPVPGVYQ